MASATYDDIKTVLDALTYATGKPTWQDGIEGIEVKDTPTCVVLWGMETYTQVTTGATPKDMTTNSFQLLFYERSWASAYAIHLVARAGINSHTISGGQWHIDSATRMKIGSFFVIVATATEQIFGV